MERSGFGTVRRAHSGRYQARVRVRGRQISIGPFDTRREAAQALWRFAASYDAHKVVHRNAGRQTVGGFAESWWKTRAGHRPSTRVRDREALDRDVLPFIRDAQLGRLETADVQQWIEKLSQRLAPSSVRRTYLDAGTIRIENNAVQVLGRPVEGPPKTRAARRSMTMPASIVEELAGHLDRQPGSKYVFGPSGERPLLADDWRTRPWGRAVLAAQLNPLRPHDLKHTGVALLALAGVDPS